MTKRLPFVCLCCAALWNLGAQQPPPPPGPPGQGARPPESDRLPAAGNVPELRRPPRAGPPPLGEDFPPALGERALVLNVSARVLDGDSSEKVLDGSRVTLPGRPVGIKVMGGNVACAVQFTPYIRRSGEILLVAQGQVWLELPDGGIRYEAIVKTIPIQFGEQVYFFPLGSEHKDGSQLEICLDMMPYSKTPNFERGRRYNNAPPEREGPPPEAVPLDE